MEGGRTKVIITVAILLAGCLLTVFAGVSESAEGHRSEGIGIDFAPWTVKWTAVDLNANGTPAKSLISACEYNGYAYAVNGDGKPTMINGIHDNGTSQWDLWVVEKKSTEWKRIPAPYDVNLKDYTVACWAYRDGSSKPTVGVDQSGNSIYGYPQSHRTVSLAPSITETVASIGAVKTLVGTDKYSNYPEEVNQMKRAGIISIVGDYTTPSFEEILRTKPDMVLCGGSMYNHIQMGNKLRDNNINSIVLYEEKTLDDILTNIYITGQVLSYAENAVNKLTAIDGAVDDVYEKVKGLLPTRTMVSLSPDHSPFVAGHDTYADGVLERIKGTNVFSSYEGWAHINSEMIMSENPSKIIILTSDYKATQADYDGMMASLSEEWKHTDAYLNGEIYLVCEEAGDMSQRPSPRVAQLAEIFAKILDPQAFSIASMPKFIGDNYRDFLTITKDIE